jgi:hypothetical protein
LWVWRNSHAANAAPTCYTLKGLLNDAATALSQVFRE